MNTSDMHSSEMTHHTFNMLVICSLDRLRPYLDGLLLPSCLPLNLLFYHIENVINKYPISDVFLMEAADHIIKRRNSVASLFSTLREHIDQRDVDRFLEWISKLDVSDQLNFTLTILR